MKWHYRDHEYEAQILQYRPLNQRSIRCSFLCCPQTANPAWDPLNYLQKWFEPSTIQ
jgi:hypothetical protein